MIFCKYFFITLVTNSKQKSRGKKNSPASHFNFLFSSDERQFLHQNLKMSSQFFGRISTISSHSTTSSLLLVSSMILLSSLPIFSRFLALGMYCVDGRSLLSFRQISSQVSAYPGSSDSLGGYCYRVVSGHVFFGAFHDRGVSSFSGLAGALPHRSPLSEFVSHFLCSTLGFLKLGFGLSNLPRPCGFAWALVTVFKRSG